MNQTDRGVSQRTDSPESRMLVFELMTGKFKLLILLVALIALPLRGMAAVAMWHCAEGQRDAMTVPAGQSQVAHAPHGDAAGHSDHHESPAQDSTEGETTSPAASACSACAACCMGGSIAPTSWSSFLLAPSGVSRITFTEQRFTGFVPARLERPPLQAL